MLATIANYDERISKGRYIESQILKNLNDRVQSRGVKFEEPTEREDIESKIDAWLINPSNKKYSVQVKYRETGDDIIFEVIKDTNRWLDGRDMLSVSQLYLFVNRQGKARLYWTDPIKTKAKELKEIAEKDLTTNPNETKWFGEGWELKKHPDHATGTDKLVAFFNPNLFPVIETWDNIL